MPSNHHVMLVEDDDDIRESMTWALESEGYRVLSASTGEDALRQLEELGRPCILLCDVRLPDMNGAFIASRCRADPKLRDTTIVMVTASPLAAPEGLPVLPKPFDLETFLQLVEQHCSAGPHPCTDANTCAS